MSKKSKHKPKGPKNPPQNAQQPPKKPEPPIQEVKEEPVQLEVERVQEQVEKPKAEPAPAEVPKIETVEEKVEEKPVQSESAPTKPKRNRNRKKKNAGNAQEVDEAEETVVPEVVEEKKPDKPEVKAEEKPEVVDVKPDEKFEQAKSKKDKKKDKNVQKIEQAATVAEIGSSVLSESDKKVEEISKSEPVQPVVEAVECSVPAETKGGKNKKNKNKKGVKEPQPDDARIATDNISCEIKKDTKIEAEKPVEKVVEKPAEKPAEKLEDNPIEKSIEQTVEKSNEKIVEKSIEAPAIEKEIVQQCIEAIPENTPRNKKNKKEQSKQKPNKDADSQSKNDLQTCTIEAVPKKPEEKETINKVEKSETCPFKAEEKPKSEVKENIPIPEAGDDILPALASSIEKTLEKLIVCESDLIASEQPKPEDDKKEKNKKKSKKDKDKPADKIEEKNIVAESPITQPELTVTSSSTEIKTEVQSSEKIKSPPDEINKDVKDKSIIEEKKIPEQDTKHLIVEEKRAASKSPTRKDKRKKSPKPPKPEEKPQDEPIIVHQETEFRDVPIYPKNIVCPIKKPEIQEEPKLCPIPEKTSENKKKKHHNKNTETPKDEKATASSVPEDIINTLLSDTPPAFIKDSESAKCEIIKPTISPVGAENEKKPAESEIAAPICPIKTPERAENVCPISKNLPVELPGKIDVRIEKEMKKALEVAIGVIVGEAPIDEKKNITTEKPAAEDKTETAKPPEEQKTCEKDNQNKQECKGKSKKNKNKHHQQDSKVIEEKDSQKTEIESAPIAEVAPVVEQKIPIKSEVAQSCPIKIPTLSHSVSPLPLSSPPVITPSSTETAQLSVSPVVTTSLEELVMATTPVNIEPPIVSPPTDSQTVSTEKDVAKKQTEDNLQQEAVKPPASPKPNKRNKDKKNKHGKGDDSKNSDNQQSQQSSDSKTSQSSEKSEGDKKQSEGEKKQSEAEKNKDGNKQKDESKGAKDSQESPASDPVQETKPAGDQFEFLPIPDSCIKGSNTQIKSCDAKSGKDKNKKERKSPPKNQPKNLLGPSDIPAKSNKLDYKKEKNKDEIEQLSQNAEIKLRNLDPRDAPEPIRKPKGDENACFLPGPGPSGKKAKMTITEIDDDLDEDEEKFVYKYSFRTVFIANACHICKATLKEDRFVCRFCHLVSYCSEKHRDDDWQTHQSLCYAICTISHAKEQNFIYGDAKSLNGHDYRLLRMQTIVSCEKMLKRKLCPWEQEALLYPRICSTASCREWKSTLLKDCEGCGQVSYCSANPAHLPTDHANWCKSFKLYYKLVAYQLKFGRLDPQLPTKIPEIGYQLPDKSSAFFEDLYGNTANFDDCHYATLTQLSTAPLTTLYAYQKFMENGMIKETMVNGVKNSSKQNFCIHLIGAELQFEGDALKKWEVFFLHMMHQVKELTIVLIGPELNTLKLPVELLSKIKLCNSCRQENRKIKFDFIESTLYHDYVESGKFIRPDIICAFNPGFHRATGYAGMDTWPETIASALRLRVPICATAYTSHEMPRDLERVKACAPNPEKLRVVVQPQCNPYSSLRPDRNFVSDDEMPLIFKNYHFMVVAG